MADKSAAGKREILLVGLALILALLHGVIYVFLIPPWQHYDEPSHFEYAWLAAHLDTLPDEDSYYPKLSRQVVKSMLEYGFFDDMASKPVIGPPSEKIKIPYYSQLSEPPAYYLLASLPLRLISSMSIRAQLYTARLVSITFLFVVVIAASGISRELFPAGHPVRWVLPVTLALVPAFIDLMSAVNNDAMAIGTASLILWVGIRLVRRGFSLLDFTLLCVFSAMALIVKITVIMILAAMPLILLFTFFRGRWRRLAWGFLAVGAVTIMVFSLRWDDAFAWYRGTSQLQSIRMLSEQAPAGRAALAILSGADVTPRGYPEVYQHLSGEVGEELASKRVTFGYWIWSDRAQRVRGAMLRTQGGSYSENLSISPEPAFYAFQSDIPAGTKRIWIYLSPESAEPGSIIYYDGLVLVEGEYPISEKPAFDTGAGERGVWGGQPFENLLRNGSAETAGPRFNPLIDEFAVRFLPDGTRPSMLFATLVDPQGSRDLYQMTAAHLFQTFWARFGWGHVPILGGGWIYGFLAGLTLLGILGAVVWLMRKRRVIDWAAATLLGFVIILYGLLTITRGGVYLASSGFYIPVARYYYPVIIPTLLVLVSGWLQLSHATSALISGFFKGSKLLGPRTEQGSIRWFRRQSIVYLLFFLGLGALSITSIVQYYY